MSALASLLPTLALGGVALVLGAALLLLLEERPPRGRGRQGGGGQGGGGKRRAGKGDGRTAAASGDWAGAFATAACAGLVLLFLLLLAMDGAGIEWRRTSLAAGTFALFTLLAVAALGRRAGRPVPPASFANSAASALRLGLRSHRPGWGDGVAAAAVAAFAVAAWTLRTAIPDFVYHWGIKGKRFQLAGGIDLDFLADPLGPVQHPDYPLLLPSLYAATAHLRGFFDERSMLLWTSVAIALVALAARSALAQGLGAEGRNGAEDPANREVGAAAATATIAAPSESLRGRTWLQAGTALTALGVAAFGIAYDLAGGGDPWVALALLLAIPALLVDRSRSLARSDGGETLDGGERLRRDDLRVGMAAALAAAVKIEGVPLAGFLLLGRLWATTPLAGPRAFRPAAVARELRRLAHRLPRLVLPLALAVVPWMVTSLRHGLFSGNNAGRPSLADLAERLPLVVRGVLEVLAMPEWFGFPWLFALLPFVLATARLRPAAAVVAAQGAFYLYVYLSAPVDTRFYVLSSLPRLLVHLLPAVLVLLVLWLAPAPDRSGPRLRDG